MALNIWKLKGFPSSINPLPTGWVNNYQVPNLTSYVISFRAKSASSGSLLCKTNGSAHLNQNISLTPNFQSFSFVFTMSDVAETTIQFNDYNNKGDIIIDSITLVQKPLSKLTVNGVSDNVSDWINGSMGGNWLDDTDDGNLTRIHLRKRFSVPIGSTISFTVNSPYTIFLRYFADGSSTEIGNSGGWIASPHAPIVLPNNCTSIGLIVSKTDSSNINVSEKPNVNIMLNLGSTPAPYSRKTGDHMMMPVAKKNLISSLSGGTINNTGSYTTSSTTFGNQTFIAVSPNTNYTMSVASGYQFFIRLFDNANTQTYVGGTWVSNQTFNTATATKFAVVIQRTDSGTVSSNDWALSNAQLEQGTVATPFSPYTVQVEKLPAKYVPKKNLFDGQWESGSYGSGSGTKVSSGSQRCVNLQSVKGGNAIIFSDTLNQFASVNIRVFQYDANKTYIRDDLALSITLQPQTAYIAFHTSMLLPSNDLVQVEYGQTATPYEPYKLILPRKSTGLAFNGLTDYIQLPSMTMDSVEVDCIIDGNQPTSSYHNIIDARTGLSAYVSFLGNGGISAGGSFTGLTGAIKDTRTTIKVNATSPFTDNLTIFGFNDGTKEFTKGILYKVTCYLNGNIVATYDFTNPQSIVGNTVIPSAKNLIPSFEDSGWNINTTYFKVMGKDTLHLDSSNPFAQSVYILPIVGGIPYLFSIQNALGNARVLYSTKDSNGNTVDSLGVVLQGSTLSRSITFGNNASSLTITLDNAVGGSFDFFKPQLFKLDGTQGTINGNPKQLNKPAKRKLYSKR